MADETMGDAEVASELEKHHPNSGGYGCVCGDGTHPCKKRRLASTAQQARRELGQRCLTANDRIDQLKSQLTTAQAERDEARGRALEEAAGTAERVGGLSSSPHTAHFVKCIAAAIRKLAE